MCSFTWSTDMFLMFLFSSILGMAALLYPLDPEDIMKTTIKTITTKMTATKTTTTKTTTTKIFYIFFFSQFFFFLSFFEGGFLVLLLLSANFERLSGSSYRDSLY